MDSKLCRFNTVSGKRCYFITFVFPSLRSGTRDVRTSSSLHSSAASHPSSHTASGKHCCNIALNVLFISQMKWGFNTASGRHCCNTQRNKSQTFRYNAVVSIPQAVGAIATWQKTMDTNSICCQSFNTASSKHYYFITFVFPSLRSGTRDVRISSSLRSSAVSHTSSHTTSGRCCCNTSNHQKMLQKLHGFNTASGRHYYFITFIFPSLRSGTRVVRTSSSLCSSATSHPSSHTTSSKCCCNILA